MKLAEGRGLTLRDTIALYSKGNLILEWCNNSCFTYAHMLPCNVNSNKIGFTDESKHISVKHLTVDKWRITKTMPVCFCPSLYALTLGTRLHAFVFVSTAPVRSIVSFFLLDGAVSSISSFIKFLLGIVVIR